MTAIAPPNCFPSSSLLGKRSLATAVAALVIIATPAWAEDASAPDGPVPPNPSGDAPAATATTTTTTTTTTTLSPLVAPSVLAELGPRIDVEAVFDDGTRTLTPADARRLAVETSPRLRVAQLQAAAAEAALRGAWVALVPRLDLSARAARVDGFPESQIDVAGADEADLADAKEAANAVQDPVARALFLGMLDAQGEDRTVTINVPRNQFGAYVRLTVPITQTIFAVLPALQGAQGRARAEALKESAARADLEFAAVEAWYRYAEARGVQAVAGEAVDQAQRFSEFVRRSVAAGIFNTADQANADARVAQAQEGLARSEAAVAIAGAALATLVGVDANERFRLPLSSITDVPAPTGTLDDLVAAAHANRPELQAMEAAIEAKGHLKDAAFASTLPILAVYAGAEDSNPNPKVFPLREAFIPSWEVGATLSWSPNDAAQAWFKTDERALDVERAQAEYAAAAQGIELELRRAWATLKADTAALQAAQVNAEAAETVYAWRQAQLAAGEAIVDDVLNADTRATEARMQGLRARIALHIAAAHLARAAGTDAPGG